jgi:hypothetical protein
MNHQQFSPQLGCVSSQNQDLSESIKILLFASHQVEASLLVCCLSGRAAIAHSCHFVG